MQSSYLLFNKIIAAIFAAIIIYCGIYPLLGNYVVQCAVEQATGHPCIGCGLTRGIHQALLLDFNKALQWNESSLLILSFLVLVLIMRLLTSILVKKASSQKRINLILVSDIAISLALYLFCFRHFFTSQILK